LRITFVISSSESKNSLQFFRPRDENSERRGAVSNEQSELENSKSFVLGKCPKIK